jgi:hypothetical protein
VATFTETPRGRLLPNFYQLGTGNRFRRRMTMRRVSTGALVAVLAAMTTFVVAWARADASWGASTAGQSGVAALRDATARFHDLGATLASGRTDLHLCVDHMGQHFADPQTFGDGVLDPVNPEAMVYADDGKGHLKLAAVEWVSTTQGDVMGIPLHFNMSVGLWVLHAWIWAPNPDGMFADMNPRIGNCP